MIGSRDRAWLLECDGARVPALQWRPRRGKAPFPLVLVGHGLGQHKRAVFPPSLPRQLADRGFAVAALDAPEHGERAAHGASLADVTAAWRRHWSANGARQVAREHAALLDDLAAGGTAEPERAGYWGLSLATQYGLGLLAAEARITAAVLGLFGLPDIGPRLRHYAPRVRCPVFFIAQSDDELHEVSRARALFDLIGSDVKEYAESPGGHTDVPGAVVERALDFLERHLKRPRPSGERG